ncbi:glycerol-3-phosphate dehydrogenase [Sinomonas cellulolyticus]|uniref:FAD-binding oxidoreductase n=1 Tax=Sinomonas cellulolyticus TaxID=2801916 RepID=A0ABS1JYN3_9MICC|nr:MULTISPECIES: FAD-dependent oxidoreductase [Sinomonas]MBL0704350.1 FAD-binding oxidoreductase [Sinomonas cellulolyticus]GHG48151.1 glycerol-3-phosphate dehydrogenase [Sinomonas sp. KCTC 49339]
MTATSSSAYGSAEDVDVLIVGGGIVGLSLASALGGRCRVALVEAEPSLAYHTSSRSAQQLIPSYGPAPVKELTRRTLAALADAADVGPDGARRLIWPSRFMLVGSRAAVEAESHEGMRALTRDEARELLPALKPEAFEAAALDTDSVRVDADALLAYHEHRAQAAGVGIHVGAPVHTAQRVGEGWLVGAGAEGFHATNVVNAAGAWADDLAILFGVERLGLQPYRRTAALVSLAEPLAPDAPMVAAADDTWYFRPDPAGALVSPSEAEPSLAEDAVPRPGDIEAALELIRTVADLKVTGIVRAWTGLRTSPQDGLPVMGFDPEAPGFFWLAGQGGYGFQTSSALAEDAAAQLLTGPEALRSGAGPVSETARAFDPHRLSVRS